MSITLGGILAKMSYEKAFREAENCLEDGDFGELSRIHSEASEFVENYNNMYDTLDDYLENPYQASFAVTVFLHPADSWKQLGYCKALSHLNYDSVDDATF